MKPTTQISFVARNVGKPNETLFVIDTPMAAAMKELLLWIRQTTMAKSIQIEIARNPAELGSQQSKQAVLDSMVDDIFGSLDTSVTEAAE